MAGVPSCLHKYEPLLREAWLRRQIGAASDDDPAAAEAAV
jgi:hypothetical protein